MFNFLEVKIQLFPKCSTYQLYPLLFSLVYVLIHTSAYLSRTLVRHSISLFFFCKMQDTEAKDKENVEISSP